MQNAEPCRWRQLLPESRSNHQQTIERSGHRNESRFRAANWSHARGSIRLKYEVGCDWIGLDQAVAAARRVLVESLLQRSADRVPVSGTADPGTWRIRRTLRARTIQCVP